MREILFRGQLRRKGEKVNMAGEPLPSIWKYGGVSQYGGGAMIYQAEPKIEKFPVYGDTVGQYTGLKDRNGTRIFEGDIVNCNYFCGVVYFYEGAWCVSEKDKYPEDLYDLISLEVIGNIHDNPELLEGEHNG